MPLNTTRAVIDAGSYFTANNGATGVATAAAPTSFSDTAPLFTILNNNANNIGRSLYLDWIVGYNTAAGTAGVDLRLKLELDTISPTGGTALTPVGTNANDPYTTSGAVIRLLPTGIAATANVRVLIGQALVIPTQAAVFTVGTMFVLQFGSVSGFTSPSVATASQAAITTRQMPPVVIPPGKCLQVPFIATTQ